MQTLFVHRWRQEFFELEEYSEKRTYQVVGAPDGLNVRTAPNSGASIVGLLPNGSKVAVFKQVGDWYEVFYKSNQYYCYGEFLKKVQ